MGICLAWHAALDYHSPSESLLLLILFSTSRRATAGLEDSAMWKHVREGTMGRCGRYDHVGSSIHVRKAGLDLKRRPWHFAWHPNVGHHFLDKCAALFSLA